MDYLAAMRAFIRSVELGSFSKAADELGMKVSTVSRHVSALEADLGAALLNRSTRNLHLTEVGARFYEDAARIMAEVNDARLVAQALNSTPQGLLRINVPAAFGRRHIVPHLKDFLALYPDIRIDATLTDLTVDLIETATDVAVRIGTLPDSRLVARKLANHRRVICANPDYLREVGPIETPADLLRGERLAFAMQADENWYFRHVGTEERHQVTVTGRLRLNDSEALLACALAGQGFALLPSWLVHDEVDAGRLRLPLVDWEASIANDFNRSIWAVYAPKKIVSPKVRVFIDFLSERFGKPAYWEG